MKNLLILFILAFSCNCMAGHNEPAHVIITAGQSNTDGRVPNDRLPVTSKQWQQIRLLRQEPTSIAELPRTVQTGNSVPSGLRVKEEQTQYLGVRCYYLLLAGTMVARAFLCYQMGNRRNFYRAFQCFGQINSLVGKSRMAGK